MNSEQLCLQELFEKLYELELPSILKSEHITKKDCTFNLASVGEYHDLYFKTDVLLLADVFEQLERLVWNTINWIHAFTFLHQDCRGMQCLKRLM